MTKKIKPWCQCCSNEHVLNVAHEIVQHSIEKHYGRSKNMCISSLSDALNIAAHLINAISVKVLIQGSLIPDGVPIELARLIGAGEQESRRANVLTDFNNADDAGQHLERAEGAFGAHHELEKADTEFAKAHPPKRG